MIHDSFFKGLVRKRLFPKRLPGKGRTMGCGSSSCASQPGPVSGGFGRKPHVEDEHDVEGLQKLQIQSASLVAIGANPLDFFLAASPRSHHPPSSRDRSIYGFFFPEHILFTFFRNVFRKQGASLMRLVALMLLICTVSIRCHPEPDSHGERIRHPEDQWDDNESITPEKFNGSMDGERIRHPEDIAVAIRFSTASYIPGQTTAFECRVFGLVRGAEYQVIVTVRRGISLVYEDNYAHDTFS